MEYVFENEIRPKALPNRISGRCVELKPLFLKGPRGAAEQGMELEGDTAYPYADDIRESVGRTTDVRLVG